MDRRIALKQAALTVGGLLVLPAWASAWTPAALQSGSVLLTASQAQILTDVVDTLIPASDSLGAKAVGVPDFVQKMVADCYEPTVQQQVKDGLAAIDAMAGSRFGRPFAACDTAQRTTVLQQIETTPEAERRAFWSLLKNLTIQGYTTSEYVMTNFLHYTPIPGHYYGCVPVPLAAK